MALFSRLFGKRAASAQGRAQTVQTGTHQEDGGYWITREIDLPVSSRRSPWYRATLPALEAEANAMRGPDALPGKHASIFNLQDFVRHFGLLTLMMWSNGVPHAAGAVKVSSASEHQLIDHIRRIPGDSVVFRSGCFLYPEYPIIYMVAGIPLGNGQLTILRSVPNFADGDLQEFVLSLGRHHTFILHLFDDEYRHISDISVPQSSTHCDQLLAMFDRADAHFKSIPKDRVSFSTAGDRFNQQYPDDFWP